MSSTLIPLTKQLIQHYNVAGPRYTSYPTAPQWTTDVTSHTYTNSLRTLAAKQEPVSLYIHIPFCQKLCYFCGCLVKIRQRESRSATHYLHDLFREIDMVSAALGYKPHVFQFHIGGGTPNFLSETEMESLWHKLNQHFHIDTGGEVAIEIDPRTTTLPQLRHLRELGFNRISMGIQDFDPKVQESINRIQPYDMVSAIHRHCQDLGFSSINFDLIYGLPFQTLSSFKTTIDHVLTLKPHRIALYSFAHVPWLKKHQELIKSETLPSPDMKIDIFLQARQSLLQAGYDSIAMDHFALTNDEMAKAFRAGTLYRNFMGYTLRTTKHFLGLGLSSIGFVNNTYVQNHKDLPAYHSHIERGLLPTERGKVLSTDDQIRLWTINALMCQFRVDKKSFEQTFFCDFDKYFANEQKHLRRCQADGLVHLETTHLTVTDLGKIFVRNICMGFDAYLKPEATGQKFSQTI